MILTLSKWSAIGLAIPITIFLVSACEFVPEGDYLNKQISDSLIEAEKKLPTTEYVPWWLDLSEAKHEDASKCRKLVDDTWKKGTLENCKNLAGIKKDNNELFFALTLSGGGLRAAAFSAFVMAELEKQKILKNVDVISSVSGGSLIAAYYATTCRDGDYSCPGRKSAPTPPVWNMKLDEKNNTIDRINKNYFARWFKGLNPFYSYKYWLNTPFNWDSSYNRSGLMAHLYATHMYPIRRDEVDSSYAEEWGLLFRHLNAARPNLILNATDYTTTACRANLGFSFTRQEFKSRQSALSEFPISRAVMASAAFPGIFPYVTLRDYGLNNPVVCDNPLKDVKKTFAVERDGKKFSYVHLFDGGASDNLGLNPVKRILEGKMPTKPKKILVLSVNAGVETFADADKGDPASALGRIFFDPNMFSGMDGLHIARDHLLRKALDAAVLCRDGICTSTVSDHPTYLRCEIALTDLRTGSFVQQCKEKTASSKIRKCGGDYKDTMTSVYQPKNPGLWKKVKMIGTTIMDLDKDEVESLKKAAETLVGSVKQEISVFVNGSDCDNSTT